MAFLFLKSLPIHEVSCRGIIWRLGMRRLSAFLVISLFVFWGGIGTASALPFEVTHDYSGNGTYRGQDYVSLWAGPAGTSFGDSFLFPSVTPAASLIDSAFVSITHVGNLSGPINAELWVLTGASAFQIGTLSSSGSPLLLSNWVTDTFALSQDVINTIMAGTPWTLAVNLAEMTSLPDNLWVASATFGGQYSAVPEPSTMLLLGTGLVGLVGLRRRFIG
jgi:hypothetical protein